MFQKQLTHRGITYTIKAPSRNPSKKYDVFIGDKFITSFGAVAYQHYKDKIGYYSNLNHNDKQRRANYRARHQGDKINNPAMAGFWAYRFLW